ncbi:alpha-ketoacid dehydrogenase subunit beta [Egibacter rhizosphaerae]|uniref:3-methyl-2-oxobutanoate dehydrogenase (2-methylpropanoyl-transferring) n=1 Tax=Egibacter rhizosphaerae TaxID=1670831 RepID=A0A411YCV0_9ACTN|nr:alpha-ketoacid dehydrogenase subunit beta [Egibacter rhizosphaerae]QBI19029.1 alpha-ketoacid dehydrogenase subunit beta [Egibacter rhizosphaerae]
MSVTMAAALNTALHDAMEMDDGVVVFGEDVGVLGGVFRITDKLQERFGGTRCFDTPLAESGIVGTAIGMAMYGYKPVVEMQFDGFTYPAFEQLVSHLAKMRNRSRGALTTPVVVRIPYGGGIGAVEHHSESPEAYFAHTAGLKVVSPGTPGDAYSLLREAVSQPDPVIFFEPKRRYWSKEEIELPIEREPFGTAVVRRAATSPGDPASAPTATLFAYGPMVRTCLDAATAAEDEGWDLEVVDLRTLVPLDVATIVDSVQRTGRAVVVHEAQVFAGYGAELAARVTESAFYHLEAPVLRVGGFDIPYPPAKLEEYFLPDVDRVLDAVERSFAF